MFIKKFFLMVLMVIVLVGTTISAQAAPQAKTAPVGPVEVSSAVYSDVSGPVRDLVGASPTTSTSKEKKEKPLRSLPNMGNALKQPDGALQTSAGPLVGTTSGLNFAGVGSGDYGFLVNSAPPDTNGAVGATQYVQWVNSSFAVFNKATGLIAAGFPKAGNAIWAGFGGGCQTNNDGDPIVQYDKINNRWILTQFSVSTTPFLQCVAVSTTSDATGTYNRYAFSYGTTQFNDYPKLGVWSDGYYISYNIFNNGTTFAGSKVCAFDSAAMRAGLTATQQCFQLSNTFGGLLPSDLDGITAPPAGSPNYFMNFGTNSLNLWKFHVDWANSANTTFTGPTTIAVPAFSPACSGGGTCIPQSGTTQKLDSLADRLMYRLAYRNFGDHEALVVNHSVTAGTSVGVRWYEIRNPNGTPSVFQTGTFAPDSNYRWMGSIAMDKAGDIAVGYSVSSTSMFPAIRYTGRLASDPLGTLQAETSIQVGGGSQNANLSRWGDYSAMTVDPVDDCTFWYTSEYLKTGGSFNWSTRIASFRFPSCTNPQLLTSITVSPASASVVTGGTQQFSATGLDQNGQPMSPQPTFSWSVSGGGTISASGLFTAGAAAGGPFTVTATIGTVSGTASVTVTAPVPVLTSISVSPVSASVVTGGTQQFSATGLDQNGQPISPQPTFTWTVSGGGTISSSGLFTAGAAGGPFTVTATSGSVSGTASVTVTATPPVLTSITVSPASASVVTGGTQQFSATGLDQNGQPISPQPIYTWAVSGGGAISSSGLFTAGAAAGGPFTVTATSGLVSGTASVTVTALSPDFSITVSPASQSVRRGRTATYTVTITPINGFSGSVTLSLTGQPSGSTVTFTPNPAGTSSTLNVLTLSGTARRSYTLTIQGVSGSLSHSTTATLTVTK